MNNLEIQFMCMIDTNGKMLEILEEDREPKEGERKRPLGNYYEVFNEQGYTSAVYDDKLKMWVGVGDPITPQPQPPSEVEVLKAKVSEQNQTLSELLDILFANVPELQNI